MYRGLVESHPNSTTRGLRMFRFCMNKSKLPIHIYLHVYTHIYIFDPGVLFRVKYMYHWINLTYNGEIFQLMLDNICLFSVSLI